MLVTQTKEPDLKPISDPIHVLDVPLDLHALFCRRDFHRFDPFRSPESLGLG